MTRAKKIHAYYDYRRLWSYNAVLNFLVGGRGVGKTFGAKKMGIKNALTKGEQFIYLRRYLEELKAAKNTFFADVEADFPTWDARVFGSKGQMSKRLEQKDNESDADFKKRSRNRKWITVCYFAALSVAQSQKSVAFPKVTLIIFDEFIIEKATNSGYLKDEVTAFLNFFNTVDRGQDKTRVLLLANSVSIMNPYFSKFEIRPDKLPEISVHAEGYVLCHFPDSSEYAKTIFQTRFGRFISTNMEEYAHYAVGNQFKDAHDKLIAEKTAGAKYKYTLETDQGSFSTWYELSTGTWFILSTRPGNERILTLVAENMDKGKIHVNFNEPVIRSLRAAFNRGAVVFDKPSTRNAFVPVFDRS